MALIDLTVHGWDLARTTGQELTVDPAVVAAGHEFMDRMGDTGQKMGASACRFPPARLRPAWTRCSAGPGATGPANATERPAWSLAVAVLYTANRARTSR